MSRMTVPPKAGGRHSRWWRSQQAAHETDADQTSSDATSTNTPNSQMQSTDATFHTSYETFDQSPPPAPGQSNLPRQLLDDLIKTLEKRRLNGETMEMMMKRLSHTGILGLGALLDTVGSSSRASLTFQQVVMPKRNMDYSPATLTASSTAEESDVKIEIPDSASDASNEDGNDDGGNDDIKPKSARRFWQQKSKSSE